MTWPQVFWWLAAMAVFTVAVVVLIIWSDADEIQIKQDVERVEGWDHDQ